MHRQHSKEATILSLEFVGEKLETGKYSEFPVLSPYPDLRFCDNQFDEKGAYASHAVDECNQKTRDD